MTKAFDTVNIHQLIHKIHNTHSYNDNQIPGQLPKRPPKIHLIQQSHIKASVLRGDVLSPTLFNIYLSDIPLPKISSLNLIIYADVTITSSHSINTATQNLLPYLNEIHTWAHNNLQINPTKTTSTLMTPDPSEYNKPLNIHVNNIPIPTTSNPTILGLTFDPKLKYSTHTDNTTTKAKKNTQSPKTPHINTLGKKQRNTHHHIKNITPSHHRIHQHHLVTHHLIHLPQQTPKNPKLSLENNHWLYPRHQHSEAKILTLQNHLKLHASQLTQKASHPTHHTRSPLQIQKTIHIQHQLHPKHTLLHPDHLSHTNKKNMKTIHAKIVHDYISSTHNKILSKQLPPIHESETTTLAQLRSNKSPFILSYLNKISPSSHPSRSCPLCQTHIHDTPHLFTCPKISTTLGPESLWTDPARAAELLEHWTVLMGT